MIPRFTGAALALAAFTVAVVAGLAVGNPPALVLERAVWSLLGFCLIGLIVGSAAQAVIREYQARCEQDLPSADNPSSVGLNDEEKSTSDSAEPMGSQ